MKKFAFGILGLAALGLTAPAQAATATLKVTTCLQRSHNFTQAFLKTYLDPIDAEHGAVKLTYLGGPEVTPYQEQGSALKRGLVDMIFCPGAYYGGLMSELAIIGNAANTEPGKSLEYDGKAGRFKNSEEANKMAVKRAYRKGWELPA